VRRWLATTGCRLLCSVGLGAGWSLRVPCWRVKNTRVAGVYPCSCSQALCVACQPWGLAGGSIVVLASACRQHYLWAVLYFKFTWCAILVRFSNIGSHNNVFQKTQSQWYFTSYLTYYKVVFLPKHAIKKAGILTDKALTDHWSRKECTGETAMKHWLLNSV